MTIRKTTGTIQLSTEEVKELQQLSNSQTEPIHRVTRAKILLAYHEGQSKAAIARLTGVSRPTVNLCISKAISAGIEVALRDLGRTGRPSVITADDKVWLVSLACSKPKDYGYSAETWSHSHLAQHVRKIAKSSGHPSLQKAGKVTVQRILKEHNITPRHTAHFPERRGAQIEEKLAQVLVVYKQIEVFLPAPEANGNHKRPTIAFDDRPSIQALTHVAADFAPVPRQYKAWGSQYAYKRHGTVGLLAGIDLHDGHVHAVVEDRHRSPQFIGFLRDLDHYYPSDWKLKLVLDDHAAHISKETMQWLAGRPGRFEFVFAAKRPSELNMVEVLLSKMARSFLRSLRVSSKAELVHMLYRRIEEMNESPVY